MAEVWQTIEQAAVTLGLSVRTVNRHITGGKLQSRLFEGRREVLVDLPEPVKPPEPAKPSAPRHETVQTSTSSPSNPNVNFTMGGGQPANPSVTVDPSAAPSANASAAGTGTAASGTVYDSVRRAMSADYSDEKPLDLRTMLTLADSADDKASLAVAAYQTLARSSELQVQSLRKVALGAWASVGVLAVGAIVAVGLGTHRLAMSEGTSSSLRIQDAEQRADIAQLKSERDQVTHKLVELRIASARLEDRIAYLADANAALEAASHAVRAAARNQPDTQPVSATQPSADAPVRVVETSTTRPTTQPAVAAAATPVRSPTTHPTSNPAMTGQRPSYMTNSREPFDPR